SVTVMPDTPTSCSASFTSSSLNGLMIASIFFIGPPTCSLPALPIVRALPTGRFLFKNHANAPHAEIEDRARARKGGFATIGAAPALAGQYCCAAFRGDGG